MDCFRQIFRCLKAPFRREKGRVINIGYPTDFRKEELPACFSDAESVLSPSQNPTERPILTTQSQDPDVAGQPHNDHGEGRNDDRDDATVVLDKEQSPRPCPQDEPETIANRVRKHMKISRWWKSTPQTCNEDRVPADSIAMERI